MIEASDLKISNESMTLVIDQTGIYYRIPIACISEPSKFVEKQEVVAIRNKKQPDEKTFNVRTELIKGNEIQTGWRK